MAELTFPLHGLHVGFPPSKQPPGTSRDLNNVRPYWNGEAIGGQRPAADKAYAQRIGGNANFPVVAMCSVTTVD